MLSDFIQGYFTNPNPHSYFGSDMNLRQSFRFFQGSDPHHCLGLSSQICLGNIKLLPRRAEAVPDWGTEGGSGWTERRCSGWTEHRRSGWTFGRAGLWPRCTRWTLAVQSAVPVASRRTLTKHQTTSVLTAKKLASFYVRKEERHVVLFLRGSGSMLNIYSYRVPTRAPVINNENFIYRKLCVKKAY
jgi:hypothetical protein